MVRFTRWPFRSWGKSPRYLLKVRVDWPQKKCGRFGEGNNRLPPVPFEPRLFSCPPCSLVAIQTKPFHLQNGLVIDQCSRSDSCVSNSTFLAQIPHSAQHGHQAQWCTRYQNDGWRNGIPEHETVIVFRKQSAVHACS